MATTCFFYLVATLIANSLSFLLSRDKIQNQRRSKRTEIGKLSVRRFSLKYRQVCVKRWRARTRGLAYFKYCFAICLCTSRQRWRFMLDRSIDRSIPFSLRLSVVTSIPANRQTGACTFSGSTENSFTGEKSRRPDLRMYAGPASCIVSQSAATCDPRAVNGLLFSRNRLPGSAMRPKWKFQQWKNNNFLF